MFDTVVMSGDDVCCSVVFGTLVGVFVFSVMWSELLMTSAISCPLWSSVYECQSCVAHLVYPQVRPGPKFCKSVKIMVTLVDTAKCIVFHIATVRIFYGVLVVPFFF